ncbi:MAG TPA: OmpA family protein [Chitinophagaceae bacterium]|nr:OmpA family protein [Chitinophagaceae bacterium]
MKHLIVSLLTAIIIIPAVYGQDDEIRSSEIGVSFNLYDYKTAQLIRTTSLSAVIRDKQFGKIKNMSAGIGLHYFKGLKKHIDFAGSLNGTFLNQSFPNKPNDFVDRLMVQLEGTAQFKMVTDKYWFQPFLIGGFGAQRYHVYYGAYIPLGVGLNINFFNEGRLFINSTYRVPITTGSANYHFMHAFGVSARIGKKKEPVIIAPPPPPPPPKDSDNDGIIDDNDKCPTVPGVAKYEGCPVPDTDKDGINDDNDKCPTVAGLAKYQGCPVPDTDKDGINDEEDKCPNEAGVARYGGCPVPDRDKDGINDEEDKCPDVFGVAAQQGCPEISAEVTKTVEYAAKNVYFATGSTKLLKQSYKPLDELVKVLSANTSLKLKIDGHTDNVGADDFNMKLSDGRAASVKNYLASKGISADRLESEGYGETMPVADNKTAAGRTKNRRVEMKVFY